MRSKSGRASVLRSIFGLVALAATMGVLAGASSAQAGGSRSDRIYADSFGNLVVHSRGGYKRIVVGQGHLAQELADYEQPRVRNEDVIYYEDRYDRHDRVVLRECWKPAVLLKGRGYMFGLEDGELPDLPGRWCD